MKLGAARSEAPSAWRFVKTEFDKKIGALTYSLDRDKLRKVRRREGRYLLRTNLTDDDPAKLWQRNIQLVSVNEAFKTLKGDLAIRPASIRPTSASRLISSSPSAPTACKSRSRAACTASPPGLTARSALAKFATVPMIDVHLPTTDGRQIILKDPIKSTALQAFQWLGDTAHQR